ncbi:MFS transporter [Rathayibacter oskolensis]|uniref:MFS transporter n=1 Tax=Rathayibacter oskolensis TaxID=1891671 RepID=UPI00265D94A5|nr:MFS transporter [Rathayibacter oskolensis]WKK70468.1 MFS transporter [Rathayibacter oskolensis]
MTSTAPVSTAEQTEPAMPWLALALLATMGFLLVAAETMPAGLLPVIAEGMGISEGTVGQFISVWALGTVIVTVPAISLTRGLRRKPLLLSAIACLIAANTVTALSSDVVVSLVSRFLAGAFTGIIWGMLAAYGRRISPPRRAGLALSIVSVGAPVGFALGTPLGAWLGTALDWRWSFGGLSLLALVTFGLIALFVPDAPGQPKTAAESLPLARVLAMPGVGVVCLVIVVWMLAHNTIYTYIAPFLREGARDSARTSCSSSTASRRSSESRSPPRSSTASRGLCCTGASPCSSPPASSCWSVARHRPPSWRRACCGASPSAARRRSCSRR